MAEATFSLDLHVLGPPLTFALSQDQTLQLNLEELSALLNQKIELLEPSRTRIGQPSFRRENRAVSSACYLVFKDRCDSSPKKQATHGTHRDSDVKENPILGTRPTRSDPPNAATLFSVPPGRCQEGTKLFYNG